MATLNYKTFGSGDPVVIMHGLFGMLDNWQTIAKKLAEHYMVYIVDLRDHGKSDHTDEFNYQLLAQDIADFLESEWIHSAYIIGHSMGGKTALQLTVDHPDLVEKLVVVDIGTKKYPGGHETIIKALNAVPIGEVQSRKEVEEVLSEYVDEPGVRLFLMKNLSREKTGGYRWKMNLPLLTKHYQDILDAIQIEEIVDTPTMFIRGGKSRYISDEDIKIMNPLFEDVRWETVTDAGHWVHAEQPSELLSLIRSFLD